MPTFLARRQDLWLGISRPQRIFDLYRRDQLDCVCAADGLRSCFGKAKVLHLSLLEQFFAGPGNIFDWNIAIAHRSIHPHLSKRTVKFFCSHSLPTGLSIPAVSW